MLNKNLYYDLYNLRKRIKDRERLLQGRAPTVCSDLALNEMVALCPKKLSDFESIEGIGKTFIDNYGEQFLSVILKYTQVRAEKKVELNSSVSDTLKELEKKLVSINRRNRLLYMPKLSNKYAFDMFELGIDNLKGFLFERQDGLTLVNIDGFSENDYQKNSAKFKRISQLLREVNKDLRDKGQNDLYIGYPYVIGRIPGENFDVRAPLALFPVVAEKSASSIKLVLDETRDVIYNNTLILAYFKFNNINNPLPSEVVENINCKSFFESVLDFYSENGIQIRNNASDLMKYREYKAEEFPKFNSGEMYIEHCAVLGKFPICSNSIQKDFGEIIKNSEINTLLNDLLLNCDDMDFYSDSYDEKKININEKQLTISEKNIVYINELNSSQEAVLSAINSCNELVVQGPPGTGKSQVITSLIAEFVSSGKTVLMVSEKKTALDVVYSRLGNLSQYALLIDDVGNKEAFYRQLSSMMQLGSGLCENADLNAISSNIDALIGRLEKIADKLYSPGEVGVEPYRLYAENKRYDFSDVNVKKSVSVIRDNRDADLLKIKYNDLNNIHRSFSNIDLCVRLERYLDIITDFPWLVSVRGDMSEYDIFNFLDKLELLKDQIAEWSGKGVIGRFFSKSSIKQTIGDIISVYFKESTKELEELIFSDIEKVIEGINRYEDYQDLKVLCETLSETEMMYFNSVYNIKKVSNKNLIRLNDELYNELVYEHICKFESENRDLIGSIDNFDSTIRSLSEMIARKQKLSYQRLDGLLKREMYNIANSKRNREILRMLESKRKWSVNKFIKKFNFELFKGVKIWLLTPEVVSEIIPLQTGIFDLVVFDEASQMYVEKGLPSILRAKKVVIAGDQKQLRPSNLGEGRLEIDIDDLPEDQELSAALEEESLLDLARFKYNDILLNFHYRSKYEELIAFSNYAFYKGRLYVSPNATTPTDPPIQVHKMDDAMWTNRSNMEEAKYIVNMLKNFFDERRESETIGIITFNSNQRDLIDDLIDEECAKDPHFAACIRTELMRKKNGEDIGLFVKNIESVQGDERDVIIFSIGYAKNENGRLIRNFGWLNQKGGENRLNVAISRARKKVHIVTSFEPEELQVEDTKNDGPRILKKYLQYAFAVSSGDNESAKQILNSFGDDSFAGQNISFDSDFENQVYDALTSLGYTVDTQVGIGGYNIDLAIKKNDKYILGIECDGRLYHSSKSARERDYHRQKYLESRGWRIHRIWSTNWWKNPKREINKISLLVNSIS